MVAAAVGKVEVARTLWKELPDIRVDSKLVHLSSLLFLPFPLIII